MATTYTLIEKITVNAATATAVTFSNIPQTYTDLVVRISARGSRATQTNDGLLINLNGVTTNITNRYYESTGSGTPSTGTNGWGVAYSIGIINGPTSTAATFGNAEVYIPSYASAVFKPIIVDAVMEDNATTAFYDTYSVLWSSTSAINSVGFTVYNGGSFQQYSEFSLYGVTATGATSAAQPKALGGDSIAFDGTYWYHAFLTSGTFTPKVTLSCDVLVVAGGGGGGSNSGAGGGAGGVFYATAQTIATAQTVIVGAGGGLATNGSNSTFASLTAGVGGGKGGQASTGFAGGSGGGGAGYTGTGTIAGGSSTQTGTGGTGYGNAGGSGVDADGRGGGGGGAGAVGGNSSGINAAAGGAGKNTWSSWLSATGLGVSGYIAGGGGGGAVTNYGAGGSGGGGQGGNRSQIPTNGVANTGGGGGGVSDMGNAGGQGLGGSGLIIVRYAG